MGGGAKELLWQSKCIWLDAEKKKNIYDLHKKCLNNCVTLNPLHLQKSGVLAFTCNLATLKAEFWNGLGSVPGGSDDPSIGESIV